jgi:hypothetical protein
VSAGERESAMRAVDFRGDATIETTDGEVVVGFVFDLREGAGDAALRLLPADGGAKVEIPLSRIRRVELTGKDAASGKTWENWIRRYAEKKLAGEAAGIDCEPIEPS